MRWVFPDDPLAYRVRNRALYSGADTRMRVYLDEAVTQLAPITTYPQDTPIVGSTVTVGSDSMLPLWYGPDGATALWCLIEGTSTPYRVDARMTERVFPVVPFCWSYSGVQEARAGRMRLYLDADYEFSGLQLGAGTAPTGAPLVLDINVDGTTIFGIQSARPQVAAGAHAGSAGAPTVTDYESGSYLTVDVDEVGSGEPGGDLSLLLALRRKE